MDKTELAKRIREIEGLTNEERSELLALLNSRKRYGLVWEDKPEEAEEILKTHIPVLTEVKDKEIDHDTETQKNPNHILIEGDNLHALTSLCYTHEGKIDVIYIDPPYNTGNKDFVYNDSYVDSEDSYRHSKWLSFMNKRLRIAKRLLSDRGVIFLSIDDNEQANLKLLCDEVFGEDNFVGSYFWKRTATPPALSYKIRRKLEFVLCYQKQDIIGRTFAQGYVDGGDAPLLNSGNPIGVLEFPEDCVRFNIQDGLYRMDRERKIELIDDVLVENGVNKSPFKARAHFKWSQSNLLDEVSKGTFFVVKSKQFSIRYQKAEKATKVPSNIIDEEVMVATNEEAQKELANLSLGNDFNYAKPTSLVCYLIRMPFWKTNCITILDFFAGSGTTLHATMQLNAEDGGHRQCILVTNNENDICEKVTYERNKRVINGYTTPKGVAVEGLKANNLRYFKCEMKPRELSHQSKRELVMAMTDILRIKEDIYTEQNQFGSLPLNGKARLLRYFADGDRRMLIVYDTRVLPFVIKEIGQMEGSIKIYLFADGAYPYTEDFRSVMDKVELVALPHAFSQALKHVLPQAPEEALEEPDLTEEEQAAMMEEAIEAENNEQE